MPYLVARSRLAQPGRIAEATEFGLWARDHVHAASGLDVAFGVNVFGRPAGTFTWGAIVPGRAAWVALGLELLADAEYSERVQQAAELFIGPAEDAIRQILHTTPSFDMSRGRPNLVQSWTAQIARMRLDEGIAWSVKVADYVDQLTGHSLVFLGDAYGEFGSVAWLLGADNAAQIDTVNETMMSDPGWRRMVLEAGDLFIDGRTRSNLHRNF